MCVLLSISLYRRRRPSRGFIASLPTIDPPYQSLKQAANMFTTFIALLALAAAVLAQAPEGYRTVYMTSMVDTQYVITPISAAEGSGLVV